MSYDGFQLGVQIFLAKILLQKLGVWERGIYSPPIAPLNKTTKVGQILHSTIRALMYYHDVISASSVYCVLYTVVLY